MEIMKFLQTIMKKMLKMDVKTEQCKYCMKECTAFCQKEVDDDNYCRNFLTLEDLLLMQ